MRDVAIFLMRLLLEKKANNLLAKSENKATKWDESPAALVTICGKTLHIIEFNATYRFMISVDTLRWFIRLVVPLYSFILGYLNLPNKGYNTILRVNRVLEVKPC